MQSTIGQEITFEGVVTRSFNVRGAFISSLTNGTSSYDVSSAESFQIGHFYRVTGILDEYQGKMQIRASSISPLEGDDLLSSIISKAEDKIQLSGYAPLVKDEITSALESRFASAARKILSAKALNRFVLLRFHGDADGVSGAFALTKLCRMHALQQNSAVYSVAEAMRDLQTVHHEFMPLIILLDFGSNPESMEGLKLLKAAGCEILIIDHHPPNENLSSLVPAFVSPWAIQSKDDVSHYPAGYLAIEVARLCGNTTLEEYAKVSCAGDKSTILEVSAADKDKALVLDYMASYSGFGNNLDFYYSVMSKPELFSSMLFQAREKIEQIFESVKQTMRQKEINGIKVVVVDLERLSRKHEFPSKGKIATRVFESINMDASDRPLVVLGYADKSVIFRINDVANAKGIFADQIINDLKKRMRELVETGGGHAKAAALRVREDFAKDVIDEILKVIEAETSE